MKETKEYLSNTKSYIKTFIKWIIVAGITGAVGGFIGGVFHRLIEFATEYRVENSHIIYFLPLAGLLIVFLYRVMGLKKDPGTNIVLSSVSAEDKVPLAMSPLIFLSTIITHLFGGSAGREGAALQLGGSLAYSIGKAFRLDRQDMHTIVLCGMSAVFSALFCTPVTAAVFAIEVVSIGIVYYSAIMPCVIASFAACIISVALGNHAVAYTIAVIPEFNFMVIGKVLAVAFICGAFSIVECVTLKKTHKLLDKIIPSPYVRVFAGGLAIVLLTLLIGNNDYNGAGMNVVERAIGGEVIWYAFILKLIFTAVTIGSGFKGGEIVPTFFIGATLGALVGSIIGLDVGFSAAVGLIAMFCGVVNCPVASIVLSVELFGAGGLPLFALSCAVSYMMSGNYGLYSSQKIMYSKIKDEIIDKFAN